MSTLNPGERSVCEAIRQLRRETFVSQRQLAGLIGVSLRSVKRWEGFQNVPTREHLRRVARLVDYLDGLEVRDGMEFLPFLGGEPGRFRRQSPPAVWAIAPAPLATQQDSLPRISHVRGGEL